MTNRRRGGARALAVTALCIAAACGKSTDFAIVRESTKPLVDSTTTAAATATGARWCDKLPRAGNAALEHVAGASDWFDVYRVAPGVFALAEPRQFQEAISWLIVGRDTALLFDTGIGVSPIRPVVERLTKLPVEVINSHTHYDHVGGNHEFERVLAVDTPYTHQNAKGFDHAALAGEVTANAFCAPSPAGLDTAKFRTQEWRPSRAIHDGDRLSLGERTIQVLQVPGHTPDALALLDSAGGFLWSGDTFYNGPIWLYVPETDLDAYERSMARLAALAPRLTKVFPAHNVAVSSPEFLARTRDAIALVRSGKVKATAIEGGQATFDFKDFGFLIAEPLLSGRKASNVRGGSGLTRWQ